MVLVRHNTYMDVSAKAAILTATRIQVQLPLESSDTQSSNTETWDSTALKTTQTCPGY